MLEQGKWTKSDRGTPQGATISPLLANIYLHYVLDLWTQQWRKRQAQGDIVIVRYADDFIIGFQHRQEARSFLEALRERMHRFGLELHPEKTRLIEFGQFAAEHRRTRHQGKPETFSFLGFTHICARTKAGRFLLKRQTMAKRMRATLGAIREELRRRRHQPVPEQGRWLGSVVRGYFQYHAVPTNIDALGSFRTQVVRAWHASLKRRSQRSRLTWERMGRLESNWIPPAKILHPWPELRFDARTQGKSRMR